MAYYEDKDYISALKTLIDESSKQKMCNWVRKSGQTLKFNENNFILKHVLLFVSIV